MTIYLEQAVTHYVNSRLTEQQSLVVEKLIVKGEITDREMIDLGIKGPSALIKSLRQMGLEIITVPPTFTIGAYGKKNYLTPVTFRSEAEAVLEKITYE